ncbi:hypothetical protein BCV70DRAFT_197707 [Testicularia cyperi]|uniref:Uncharacterized protein n=1 Tax=Testicularia cyperi TaxID=1882483 RepID=A0A317XYX2_9BASI|nr:hypothetical protein BCV70DRAFT_197707 [Testicularia cyperi]
MLSRRSTHKRKRSSARADQSRKHSPSRWIVNLLPEQSHRGDAYSRQLAPTLDKGKQRQEPRVSSVVRQHPFNQSLELILPLPSQHMDYPQAAQDHVADDLPPSIQEMLSRLDSIASSHKTYRARVPMSLFLDPIFVTAYLRTGSLVALSDRSRKPGIDGNDDDVVCLDGQGTLILNLCKDTYQTLGLTGRTSHFSRLASGRTADRTSGSNTRFIVELPLLSPSFVPRKKGYEQALTRIRAWDRSRARLYNSNQTVSETHLSGKIPSCSSGSNTICSQHATWDILFAWSPNEDTIAASNSEVDIDTAIRFPDHLVDNGHVELLTLNGDRPSLLDSIWVPDLTDSVSHSFSRPWQEPAQSIAELEPTLPDAQNSWSIYQQRLQEAIEWGGLISIDSPVVRAFNRHSSTCVYSPPDQSRSGRVLHVLWSGAEAPLLLSQHFVSRIIHVLDDYMDRLDGLSHATQPRTTVNGNQAAHSTRPPEWAMLSCSGYPHAPLSWRSKVSLSRRFGAQPTHASSTSTVLAKGNQLAIEMNVDHDSCHDSSEEGAGFDDDDSDSSLDLGEGRPARAGKKSAKRRSKRQLKPNHTEHAFTSNSGETGWVSFCFSRKASRSKLNSTPPTLPPPSARWILVELVGTDTRS